MKKNIKRFERKWIFKNNDFLQIINSLLRSKLFFKTHYPLRKVNSIYFDTLNYISIRQNLDGISDKKKIRLRWYGNLNILNKPEIEIKSKKGFETTKQNIKANELNKIYFKNYNNLEFIKNYINKKLKTKKNIYPILTTNYDREYFISSNSMIRATVDYNLKSIFLKNFSQMDIIKNFKNTCILELKYPIKLDKFVRIHLEDITLRLSKNSKFVNSAFEIPKFLS